MMLGRPLSPACLPQGRMAQGPCPPHVTSSALCMPNRVHAGHSALQRLAVVPVLLPVRASLLDLAACHPPPRHAGGGAAAHKVQARPSGIRACCHAQLAADVAPLTSGMPRASRPSNNLACDCPIASEKAATAHAYVLCMQDFILSGGRPLAIGAFPAVCADGARLRRPVWAGVAGSARPLRHLAQGASRVVSNGPHAQPACCLDGRLCGANQHRGPSDVRPGPETLEMVTSLVCRCWAA